MVRALIGAFLVCGCGRLGFTDQAAADAHRDGDSGIGTDVAADADLGPCTLWGAFQPPVHISELGVVGDDWGPTVTADGLELYFFSARSPAQGFDIFSSTRTTTTGTWSVPVDRPDVNSSGFDASPFISEDGLTLLVTSDFVTGSFDLLISTRANRTVAFPTPGPIPVVNSGNSEEAPWLSPDGLRLYFASDRSGGGDIVMAARATTAAAFDAGTVISQLSTASVERRITLSHDELEAFITSDMGGDFDVYRSTRASLASTFSVPAPVAELNSAGDEIGVSLSASGSTIYYAYNAVAAGGDAEIWAATRPCIAH